MNSTAVQELIINPNRIENRYNQFNTDDLTAMYAAALSQETLDGVGQVMFLLQSPEAYERFSDGRMVNVYRKLFETCRQHGVDRIWWEVIEQFNPDYNNGHQFRWGETFQVVTDNIDCTKGEPGSFWFYLNDQ